MNKLENAELLKRSINSIDNLYNNEVPKFGVGDIDKYGADFCSDDRFACATPVKVFFSSWKGYFGSSRSTRILCLDDEIFREYLKRYLQLNAREIMMGMRKLMVDDLNKIKEEAIKELEDRIEKLKSIQ